jgi:hypothetical protein
LIDPWLIRLAAARRVIAMIESFRETESWPPDVLSQRAVAGAERTQRFGALIGEFFAPTTHPLEVTPEREAFVLALLLGCDGGCEHARDPGPISLLHHLDRLPIYAWPRFKRVVCYECGPAFAATSPEVRVAAERCDICEEPTTRFREFALTQPWLVLQAAACDACVAAIGLSETA